MEVYSETYRIAVHDCDYKRIISLPALGNCMLNVAEHHASTFGFGLIDLQESDFSWVISRMHFEIERLPEFGEEITISTWVSGCKHFISPRLFRITDSQGDIIVKASSLWSIIDLETRRPIDLLKEADLTPYIVDENFDVKEPIRITYNIDEEPIWKISHTVRYSDVDVNYHANSMRYVQWILDAMPTDQIEDRFCHEFDINYLHEIRLEETVDIEWHGYLSLDEYASRVSNLFELKSQLNNQTVCKALFVYDYEK